MPKGSSFERWVAKRLSIWWSDEGRDDIFWRTSQSGGRATQRRKKGKRTAGSYGDLMAIDPCGEPLFKLFTIELKRGRTHGTPDDMLDAVQDRKVRPFERTLLQTIEAARAAESLSWLLVSRRDRRVCMSYVGSRAAHALPSIVDGPCTRYDVLVCLTRVRTLRLRFVGLPLEDLLQRVTPEMIKKVSS